MAIHRDTDSLILHTDFSFAITYYTYTTTSILRESSDNHALLHHQYYPTISLIGVLLSVLYKIMFTNQISVKKVVKLLSLLTQKDQCRKVRGYFLLGMLIYTITIRPGRSS